MINAATLLPWKWSQVLILYCIMIDFYTEHEWVRFQAINRFLPPMQSVKALFSAYIEFSWVLCVQAVLPLLMCVVVSLVDAKPKNSLLWPGLWTDTHIHTQRRERENPAPINTPYLILPEQYHSSRALSSLYAPSCYSLCVLLLNMWVCTYGCFYASQ